MRVFMVLFSLMMVCGCTVDDGSENSAPKSSSGVKKARVKVQVDEQGLTVEQHNIANRLKMDNEPGSIKHLYLVSAYSGDVILYSTVKGKITSSGKRLSPYTVSSGSVGGGGYSIEGYGIPVSVGGKAYRTSEVLQDDGTYGHSMEYLFWWDVNDVYRQVYVSGGMIPIVSEVPMNFPKVIVNVDPSWEPKDNKISKDTVPVESAE